MKREAGWGRQAGPWLETGDLGSLEVGELEAWN